MALSYSAKPITATVLDAETGKPVEGVIVNAYWHLEDQGGHGLGPFNVTEAVTDSNGGFFMPGWGPMEVPQYPSQPFLRARLDPNQPWLQLFKHGYKFEMVQGDESTSYLDNPFWTGSPVRESAWDGKVIKIERFQGSDRQYVNHLHGVRVSVPTTRCWWLKNPRMTAALIREGERLKSVTGRNEILSFEDVMEYDKGRSCVQSRAIIEELLR